MRRQFAMLTLCLLPLFFPAPSRANEIGGNEVGGNGDRVTGWFTNLGFEILTELKRAEAKGQRVMPELSAEEFEKALATQVVLVDETNSAALTNQFGEIKDLKVVWREESRTFLILLDRKVWTRAYDRKEADYRMVLHAYVLAAGKRDRNYLVTRSVNLPRLLAPRPSTFNRPLTLVSVQPASDGGFLGVGNAIEVSTVKTEKGYVPMYLPYDTLVKLDSAGQEEWRQNIVAHIRSILPTDDGGYLILGLKRLDPGDLTESPAGRPRRDVPAGNRDRNAYSFVVKLNRGGEAEWKRIYCAYQSADGACQDVNLGAFEKPDGTFVILSAHTIHEMDPSGAIDGSTIRLSGGNRPHYVEPLREGGAVVTGLREDDTPYAMQFGPDGKVLWQRELAYRGEASVIVPTKGGFLLGGSIAKASGKGTDPLLMRLDENGQELWRKTFDLPTKPGKPLVEGPQEPAPKSCDPKELFRFKLSSPLRTEPGGNVRSIVPLPSGAFVVSIAHLLEDREHWMLKELSSRGDTLWERSAGAESIGIMAYPGDGSLVVPQGSRLLKIRTTLKKGDIDFP